MPPTRSRRGSTQGHRASPQTPTGEDPAIIDARYGLEPVFEPDAANPGDDRGATRFTAVQCPYCGEPFETALDLSAGSADYTEDCQICCQPIEFAIHVDSAGRLNRLTLRRAD